jgi:hypothetical protein
MDFLKIISNITAPYTSLVWSSCSTAAQTPTIKVERLSMEQMVSLKINLYHLITGYHLF